MTRTPVRSSTIVSVGYDEAAKKLEIEFRGGAVYEYDAVSKATHVALLKAPSIGKYVADNIKGKYYHRKVN